MKNSSNSGFSLVELAIVLVVIGLIMGGVLKGRELIESARLKSVISQINEYRLATATFMDMFSALPGDFSEAQEFIHAQLINGDGDGLIKGEGLSKTSQAGQFWQHLSAAGLIPQPGKVVGGQLQFNKGAPATRLGGGITVTYEDNQHWFLLGKENGNLGNGPLLTPQQALSIDKSNDNGIPTVGRIRARDGAGATANSCVTSHGTYNTKNPQPACILYFQF